MFHKMLCCEENSTGNLRHIGLMYGRHSRKVQIVEWERSYIFNDASLCLGTALVHKVPCTCSIYSSFVSWSPGDKRIGIIPGGAFT